jgi:hypothetical protein
MFGVAAAGAGVCAVDVALSAAGRLSVFVQPANTNAAATAANVVVLGTRVMQILLNMVWIDRPGAGSYRGPIDGGGA